MTTNLPAIGAKETTLRALLETQKAAIAESLPKHLTGERMSQLMLTECRKNPALLDCTPQSVVSAVLQCAQVGLEPGPQAHVYLVPYRNKGVPEVQLQIGYRGLLELIGRTGRYHAPDVRAVFDGDRFEYEFGLHEKLNHVPSAKSRAPEKLTHVYIVLRPKDGGPATFEVMTREEVDAIRRRSKSGGSGPWVTDYIAMAMKTVVRKKAKYLPLSVELQQAVTLDEGAEIIDEAEAEKFANAKAIDLGNKLGLSGAPAKQSHPPVGAGSPEVSPSAAVTQEDAPPPSDEMPPWETEVERAGMQGLPLPPAPGKDDPGAYVIPFGKNKGKTIRECDPSDLASSASWINNKATRPLTKNFLDFLAAHSAFLGQNMPTDDIPF